MKKNILKMKKEKTQILMKALSCNILSGLWNNYLMVLTYIFMIEMYQKSKSNTFRL